MKLKEIFENIVLFTDVLTKKQEKEAKERKARKKRAHDVLKKAKETGREIEAGRRRREMKSVK